MDDKLTRTLIAVLTGAGATWLAAPASAQPWDGAVTGKVTQIHAASRNNADFRVYPDGGILCGPGTPYWAYMNHDYDNYQATVALLMTARTTNRSVTLYTNKDANGFCRIGYVAAG